ncbi:hypothetical protein [Spirillospora sp. NPDC048819]|uniref:hypothetical protein n=1 Tax=Spirillospora sp. NPDC048819 TaxID=3155268 RepID=UPI0033EFB7D5
MYRTHEMRMTQAAQSGHEEWACPTCGRRILLRWPPRYDKQIIEPGDEKACHVGSATADTPPDADTPLEPGTPATRTATDISQADPDAASTEPAPTQCRSGHRWLRETGMETHTTPATPP